MRLGVVADIHLELEAFRQVADRSLAGCDAIVQLGDILNRGPSEPVATLTEVAARARYMLVGNHELAYLGGVLMQGMVETRCLDQTGTLVNLVREGRMVAAVAADTTLLVHGGITNAFHRRHLAPIATDDAPALARELNQRLRDAVDRQDFRDPVFAGPGRRAGPFWARLPDAPDKAPLRGLDQIIGHTPVADTGGWVRARHGRYLPLERRKPEIGWTVLEEVAELIV